MLAGYLLVHLAEHTISSQFHFGEEVHREEMGAGRSYAVLAELMIHAFFDGITISSGFLVSQNLGMVLFLAIFLHKIPEGFTVACPLAAGVCIYVAASDLIPEINQQPGVRLALVVFIGVGLLLGLRYWLGAH